MCQWGMAALHTVPNKLHTPYLAISLKAMYAKQHTEQLRNMDTMSYNNKKLLICEQLLVLDNYCSLAND